MDFKTGSDFEFLLNHTRPMLRTLRVDFGDLTIEDTQLTEEEVTNALIKFGDQLTTLEILWPHASFPLLNQVESLFFLQIIKSCHVLFSNLF